MKLRDVKTAQMKKINLKTLIILPTAKDGSESNNLNIVPQPNLNWGQQTTTIHGKFKRLTRWPCKGKKESFLGKEPFCTPRLHIQRTKCQPASWKMTQGVQWWPNMSQASWRWVSDDPSICWIRFANSVWISLQRSRALCYPSEGHTTQ